MRRIAFIGSSRYSIPLDSTAAKKFALLSAAAKIYAFGFAPVSFPRRYHEKAATFIVIPQFGFAALRYLALLAAQFFGGLWLALFRSVKIFVAQGPVEGAPAAWIKLLLRPFGVRVHLIVENHGDFIESVFLQRSVPLAGVVRKIVRVVSRISLHEADVLRAISKSTELQLRQWEPAKPLISFPTWTDIEPFSATFSKRVSEKNYTILFCGVLIPRKGVDVLLRAFAALRNAYPDAKLVLAGRNENGEYRRKLDDLVTELKIASAVEFTGELSPPALARRMAGAALFVLPSLSEGLGRVVFEAMATGCPVVASRIGGIPDMVSPGVNGFLVEPGNAAELGDAMANALSDPARWDAMSAAARRFALDFFSPEKYLKNYEELFRLAESDSLK